MLELILRIGFSLLVVFGLMWGLAKLARRPMAGRGGGTVAVLARQQLTRSASVAVVRVVDRALVVGVTDGQVNLLTETDLAALEEHAAAPATVREPVVLDSAPERVGPVQVAGPDGSVLAGSKLAGSALSPATWKQAVNVLRERTVRR